jgi:predicted AAA+ superfamily ATPase
MVYIQRDLEPKIQKYLDGPEYIAVIGARQAGKTTLLRHLHEKTENSVFLTFEDVEIRSLFDKDIKSFIKLHLEPYRTVFIDEFQHARRGGLSLKFVYDTVPRKKIVVSGSSSLDLTVTTVKHLAGRILSFTLYPLSFREFLSHKDPSLYRVYDESAKKRKLEQPLIDRFRVLLGEFIVFGGYPRVVLAKDDDERRTVLRNIFSIYLLRDVRDILGLIDDYQMLNLVKALALQIGNVISYHELSTLTQQRTPALKKYLNLLEKTFVLNLVKPFFTNKRTELVKNPKAYFLDTGLRNSVISDFRPLGQRPDKGHLLENFHFSEFLKKDAGLKYWRTKAKAEVDFVIDDVIPVEIKSTLAKPTPGKSLYSFIEKYGPEKAFVFSDDVYASLEIRRTLVRFYYHFSDFR